MRSKKNNKGIFSFIDSTFWALMIMGLTSFGLIIYGHQSLKNSISKYIPSLHNQDKAILYLTKAHLWLEEAILDDDMVGIDSVWVLFNKADETMQNCIDGKSDIPSIKGKQIADTELQNDLEDIKKSILNFEQLARERWDNKTEYGIGSAFDQQFDSTFGQIIRNADIVNKKIHLLISEDITSQIRIFYTYLVLWILIMAGVIFFILKNIRWRKRNEKEINNLNEVLRAIRNVNQLITREKDRDKLIKQACEELVATRGFKTAWILLIDKLGQFKTCAEAGLGENFIPFSEKLKAGELPGCCKDAIKQSEIVVVRDIENFCSDCLLCSDHSNYGVMIIRLECMSNVYGLLLVTIPLENIDSKEEHLLFRELSDDIAFALYSIGLEEERKQAEEALKKSEKRFRDITKNASEWVWEVDSEGKYTYVSSVVEKVLGYKPEEILNKHFYDLFHPEDREELKKAAFEIFAKKQSFTEFINRNIHKNGKTVWLLTSGLPMLNDDGNLIGYRGADRNITRRRQAEKALKKEKETAQRYFDFAGVVLIAIDPEQNVLSINKKGCEITGFSKEEIIGKNWFDLCIPQRMRDNVKTVYSQLMQGLIEPVEYYENPVLTKNGEERIIAWHNTLLKDDTGKIIATFSSGEDITDRKIAEEKLAAESERLMVTLRSIGDGVIATDTEGKIVLMNEIAETLTGWSEKEARDVPVSKVFNIINEKTRCVVENPIAKVLESGVVVGLANNTVLIAKDGTERFISDSGAPIRNINKDVIGVVLVFRDITEKKQMREFVSRAQRLETAGRIAGQVAHDFNNLLGPLVAYPDFIRSELPDNHPALPFLKDMEGAAEQIADINQQLLTLGRRGHYNQETLNLNEIIRQVLNQLQPLPETLVVESKLNKNLMNIKGGASQIYRVISNLLTNACDAMNSIGQLTIKTENYYVEDVSARYGRVPKGEFIKLTVEDTGCGIHPEIKSKIFDPFFTTKSTDKRKGSGLGLSVAYSVIEDHNGYIDVDSKIGKGSKFYTYFPITRDDVDLPESSEIVGGSESVLIVDDDQIQQDVAVNLLLKLGYQTSAVSSGEKAIEFLKDNPQDLLILDMIMPPGIDGAETYQRALEINSSQKAIIVSGYAESERVETALKMGVGAFIKKPLTIKSIARAVRKELDRKSSQRNS